MERARQQRYLATEIAKLRRRVGHIPVGIHATSADCRRIAIFLELRAQAFERASRRPWEPPTPIVPPPPQTAPGMA
jgi:hypothetical protein